MQDNLLGLAREWETNWQAGVDEQFINPQSTYLDFAKQVTCIDHGLPYDELPAEWEVQTGLFRKCCVYKMLDHRKQWAAATAKQKKQPPPTQRTDGYVWANVLDAESITIAPSRHSVEYQDGLVYSQFYNLIKVPFDTSKSFPFQMVALENLALDPGYVRGLQQGGKASSFSPGVCKLSYQRSKRRAHIKIRDGYCHSYGIREEHRISLSLFYAVVELWGTIRPSTPARALPYFVIPTEVIMDFLQASLNRHCLLFEYILMNT